MSPSSNTKVIQHPLTRGKLHELLITPIFTTRFYSREVNKAQTFLRHERRPEDEYGYFLARAFASTNQLESPCFSVLN